MKSISIISMMAIVLLSIGNSFAQIKNEKTETVKISGNCNMCKKTIEKAGNLNHVAKVEWNKDTKIATLNYDSEKTNQDEILKRIALAGYDSEEFLAPDDAYAKLASCCQYARALKTAVKHKDTGMAMMTMKAESSNHSEMAHETTNQNASPLKPIFDNYFSVKDALVKTDAQTAATKATALLAAIKAVKMEKLGAEEHNVLMKTMKDLTTNAGHIAMSKDVSKQRDAFALLSQNIYELIKVSKYDTPIYYQHCPMFNNGSNWLSKESVVKNPFYGAQMLTCGSTKETLK